MTLRVAEVKVALGEQGALAVPAVTIESGERLVVFGPNGAGKSSWLREIAGKRRNARAIAYLPQRAYMFRGSVHHNLGLGLDDAETERALHLAGVLNVGGSLLDQPARRLSGGERQRIALARTLATSSAAVILDEPLAALPEVDRWRVAHEVVAAIESRPSVIVTHDRDVAAVMGTAVMVLHEGAVLQLGSPNDVFGAPVSETVARIVGTGNAMRGVVSDSAGGVSTIEVGAVSVSGIAEVPLAEGSGAVALFGAETVTVYPRASSESGSARNRWHGTITRLTPVGRVVEVNVDVGVPVVALLTPGSAEVLDLHVGGQITLAVKATAVRIVPT